MGAANARCCTPQEGAAASAEALTPLVEAQNVLDQPISQPMWLIEAEEAKAAKKAKEEEAAKRLEELAAKKTAEAEEKRKAEESAATEEAAAEAAEAKAAPKKKAAAKKPAAAKAAAAEPPEEVKKTPEQVKKEEELKKKIDEAVKGCKDMSQVRYDVEVKCVSARSLRDADWLEGTSDPYCLCEGQGKVKSKFKTKTVSNKENPVWNQAAKMILGHGDTLKFTVNDQDAGKEDDLLGDVELPFDKWNLGFEGELKLLHASDTAKGRDAYLKVRVKVFGAHVEESK
eukprot:gb/GFBE01033028.1/.p1 GENE.gb/GFBE01033028.1/~~gb/GFBE01033028.1/.p1  ORF type:complete len:286 (+),score=123.12 gb/GFBE01033028.1/:1-858(+)